jgi:pilus assembly protein CpaE
VGIDSRIVSVVVNRIEKRLFGTISLSDVAHALGHEVLQGLHLDPQNIGIAQDQGLLVSEVRRKSPYAADVTKLADILSRRLTKGGHL